MRRFEWNKSDFVQGRSSEPTVAKLAFHSFSLEYHSLSVNFTQAIESRLRTHSLPSVQQELFYYFVLSALRTRVDGVLERRDGEIRIWTYKK
jgi:hypothetical protein